MCASFHWLILHTTKPAGGFTSALKITLLFVQTHTPWRADSCFFGEAPRLGTGALKILKARSPWQTSFSLSTAQFLPSSPTIYLQKGWGQLSKSFPHGTKGQNKTGPCCCPNTLCHFPTFLSGTHLLNTKDSIKPKIWIPGFLILISFSSHWKTPSTTKG